MIAGLQTKCFGQIEKQRREQKENLRNGEEGRQKERERERRKKKNKRRREQNRIPRRKRIRHFERDIEQKDYMQKREKRKIAENQNN